MVRTKKNPGPAADFTKAKRKLGGRKVTPANETQTEFRLRRINVPSQLQHHPDAPGTDLVVNVGVLLSKTRHHNARERRQAIDQLRRAMQRFHGNVTYSSPVTNIIRVTSRLLLDDDGGVRRALQALLRSADFDLIAPFAQQQLSRFVLAAMTHPSMPVRVDGVAALGVILDLAASTAVNAREQFLSALLGTLTERLQNDALALSKGKASAVLRCCASLLALDVPSTTTTRDDSLVTLALLHTPDPFQPPSANNTPISRHVREQLASSLVECAIECASGNAASLALCIRCLQYCIGPDVSQAVRDRVREHITPLAPVSFDFDAR